jgi:hypothetical protein
LSCDLTGREPGSFREQNTHGEFLALTMAEIHVGEGIAAA